MGTFSGLEEFAGQLPATGRPTRNIRFSGQGDTYEDAKATLEAALLEGTKLIVIRTDR